MGNTTTMVGPHSKHADRACVLIRHVRASQNTTRGYRFGDISSVVCSLPLTYESVLIPKDIECVEDCVACHEIFRLGSQFVRHIVGHRDEQHINICERKAAYLRNTCQELRDRADEELEAWEVRRPKLDLPKMLANNPDALEKGKKRPFASVGIQPVRRVQLVPSETIGKPTPTIANPALLRETIANPPLKDTIADNQSLQDGIGINPPGPRAPLPQLTLQYRRALSHAARSVVSIVLGFSRPSKFCPSTLLHSNGRSS